MEVWPCLTVQSTCLLGGAQVDLLDCRQRRPHDLSAVPVVAVLCTCHCSLSRLGPEAGSLLETCS